MRCGFKTIKEEDFPNYHVYTIVSGPPGTIVHFDMNPDQVGIATWYDGSMTITEAFNPSLVGQVLHGLNVGIEFNTEREWYTSRVDIKMKNWLCFHSTVYKTGVCVDESTVNPPNTESYSIPGTGQKILLM